MEDVLKISSLVFKIIPWVFSLGGLHVYLYNKYPKYYFFIVKHFSKWRDTKWTLTVQYKVRSDFPYFEHVNEVFKKMNLKREVVFNLKNKKQYNFQDFTVTLQHNLMNDTTEYIPVEIIFNPINTTLYSAEKKLLNLRKFFHQLEKELPYESPSFHMRIEFTTMKNPFFSLLIQRLGEENIRSFRCEFPLSIFLNKGINSNEKTNYSIVVYKDNLSINEENFDDLEEITKKCLLLR